MNEVYNFDYCNVIAPELLTVADCEMLSDKGLVVEINDGVIVKITKDTDRCVGSI